MSREMKLTPWFDGSVKPVRVGWYERAYGNGNFPCTWDGKKWRIDGARSEYSMAQKLPWRGLAQQPKGKK